MAKILDMPKLSPTMEEGVLSAWHKKEGDPIEVDDLLAEVETDKATMEFRAFDKGVLLKILVEPGATVKLGQAVGVVGAAGEDPSSALASIGGGSAATKSERVDGGAKPEGAPADEKKPAAEAPPAKAETAPKEPAREREVAPAAPKGDLLTRTERDVPPPPAPERGLASPYVRKLAREQGVDLSRTVGTGEHGRIVPKDLEKAEAPAANALAKRAPESRLAEPEARPLSPMRKTIARRLTQSKTTVPHFYLTIDVDADALVSLREDVNRDLAKAAPRDTKPEKISLNDLVIKAVAVSLARVPECNATFTEEAILIHRRVDVSVAVAIADGLVTPVVRDADKKSVLAIAREVRSLAARAKDKKLKPEEMSDGTFSVSNLGMFGIDEFSAVINPPEGAILAVGQTRDVPVVRDGAVVPGKKLAMTLSCDHRVIDGAVGASFLAELRRVLENPMLALAG